MKKVLFVLVGIIAILLLVAGIIVESLDLRQAGGFLLFLLAIAWSAPKAKPKTQSWPAFALNIAGYLLVIVGFFGFWVGLFIMGISNPPDPTAFLYSRPVAN